MSELLLFSRASAGCVWMTNGRFTVALDYTANSVSDNLDDFQTYFYNAADVSFFYNIRIMTSIYFVPKSDFTCSLCFDIGPYFDRHTKRVTVMILSFRTDRPGQTVQTQIRLLLEEQSDQGLHCLPFRLHRLDSLVYGKAT